MTGAIKYQSLLSCFVCMFVCMQHTVSTQQEAYNSALAFTLRLYRASRSVRCGSPGSFWVFWSMDTALSVCVASQISRNMSRAFQSLQQHYIPQSLLLSFSINILFSPLLAATKTFSCKYFNKHCLCTSSSRYTILSQVTQVKASICSSIIQQFK